jgi:hypothetical protein
MESFSFWHGTHMSHWSVELEFDDICDTVEADCERVEQLYAVDYVSSTLRKNRRKNKKIKRAHCGGVSHDQRYFDISTVPPKIYVKQ